MKTWFDSYKDAMRRTRWISKVAAILVLLQIAREFWAVHSHFASMGMPLSENHFAIRDILLGTLIGLAFGFRLWFLRNREPDGYWRVAIFWWVAAILLLIYNATRDSYFPQPQCNPEPGKVCFTFYDLIYPSHIEVAASVFILLSAVRVMATALAAIMMSRTRLK